MHAVTPQYLSAVRNGGAQIITVDALYNGSVLAGGSNLPVVSGSVTDTTAEGVRRTLDVELLAVPGLFDLLAPIGVRLRVKSTLRYQDGTTETIPMGLFEVQSVSQGYGVDGTLKVSASDKWVKIQQQQFLIPYNSTPSARIVDQISVLIQRTYPGETVIITATSPELVGSKVWEGGADKAILDLAKSIGAWVYFDRDGVARIANIPTDTSNAVWTIDASASGVLLGADRSRDRSKTCNVVVVNPDSADGTAPFGTQIVGDNDTQSPTYISGPFGQVPYFYSSPLLNNAEQAYFAGQTILSRTKGLNAQLSLTQVRNHALNVWDTVTVLLPRERYDMPRPVEYHVIDKLVHPLRPEGEQQVETRSTRTDEYQ